MRQNRTYGTLLAALALAGGMLCGCSSETENMSATENGGYISFSVADNASRTMIDPSDPTTIKWVENDTVTIYSPDCVTYTDDTHTEASHFAEYTVHIDADGTAKLNFNKYGLVWPKYEDCPSCRFYAVQGPEKSFARGWGNNKISTFPDGYLQFRQYYNPASMYRTEQEYNGEKYIDMVKPFLLAEKTAKNSSPVSLNFVPYSSTIDFCVTNLTGGDITITYCLMDAWLQAYNSAYVKWDIAEKKCVSNGTLQTPYEIFPGDYNSHYYYYHTDPETIALADNGKVHFYVNLPVFATPYHLMLMYTQNGEGKSGTIDLSDYTFECGKVYKMAINIGPKYVVKGNATQNGTLTIEQQNPGMTYTGTVNF